jgi:hypothetical protein
MKPRHNFTARHGTHRGSEQSGRRYRGYDELTLRTYADVPWNAPFYATCGFTETEPATDFHRHLHLVEAGLGLSRYSQRRQVTMQLIARWHNQFKITET